MAAAAASATALRLEAPRLAAHAQQAGPREEAQVGGGPAVGAQGGGRGAGGLRPPGGRQAEDDVTESESAGGKIEDLTGCLR